MKLFRNNNLRRMSSTSINYKNASKLLNPKTTVAKIISQTKLKNDDAKFLNLERLEYISPLGKKGIWEIAKRTTRPKTSEIDAVIIVPILTYPDGTKKLVLVRQFRPPINGVCIELPAGLVDPNDSVESCAIRELKEETGYVGKVRKTSNVIWSDPGLTDANSKVVWIDVDMKLEENKNPVPHWMDSEVIEVVQVNLKDLETSIDEWHDQGYLLDAKVQTLLIGLML